MITVSPNSQWLVTTRAYFVCFILIEGWIKNRRGLSPSGISDPLLVHTEKIKEEVPAQQ